MYNICWTKLFGESNALWESLEWIIDVYARDDDAVDRLARTLLGFGESFLGIIRHSTTSIWNLDYSNQYCAG